MNIFEKFKQQKEKEKDYFTLIEVFTLKDDNHKELIELVKKHCSQFKGNLKISNIHLRLAYSLFKCIITKINKRVYNKKCILYSYLGFVKQNRDTLPGVYADVLCNIEAYYDKNNKDIEALEKLKSVIIGIFINTYPIEWRELLW